MPATRTILAVAIGCDSKSIPIKSRDDAADVRPYITGLIDWLSSQPDPPVSSLPTYQIGDTKDYVIDYREYTAAYLHQHRQEAFTVSSGFPTSYVILCLSTTVAREAAKFTKTIPIVAIVSDPFAENFDPNVCGVSAKRPGHIIECYNKFKEKAGVTKVYALLKQGYSPSENSMKWLGGKVIPVPIGPNADCAKIGQEIGHIPDGENQGLLILPVDQFFGAGDQISGWANAKNPPMRDFWTVSDWPKKSWGGYGFPQQICGQYLAEPIASIWDNNAIPDPPWVLVDEQWIGGKP